MRRAIVIITLVSFLGCATVDEYGHPYPEPQRTVRQHVRATQIDALFGFIIGVPLSASTGFSPFIAVGVLALYGAITGDVIMEEEQNGR